MPSTTTKDSPESSTPPAPKRKINWKRVLAPAIVVVLGLLVSRRVRRSTLGAAQQRHRERPGSVPARLGRVDQVGLTRAEFAGAQDIQL